MEAPSTNHRNPTEWVGSDVTQARLSSIRVVLKIYPNNMQKKEH